MPALSTGQVTAQLTTYNHGDRGEGYLRWEKSTTARQDHFPIAPDAFLTSIVMPLPYYC